LISVRPYPGCRMGRLSAVGVSFGACSGLCSFSESVVVVQMIDLLFYFACDKSPVFSFVPSISILSVFFDLICEGVGAGTRKTGRRKWSGATVFGFGGLTGAGRFVLILDDLVEGVPEVCDGFVFCGH
jgi:hypothetical protein